MYQLGLSPATAEVPSMSAVALGANRWASRVVVVLQLAAWSAVGIVLLQKGVSSLQKTPVDVKNVTKANYNETAVANLMMKIVFPEKDDDLSSTGENIRDAEYPGLEKSKNSIGPAELGDEGAIGRSIPSVIPLGSLTPNHLSDEDDDTKKAAWSREKNGLYQGHKYSKINFQDVEKDPSLEPATTVSSWVKPTSTSSEKYVNVFEARKKLKTSNLNSGGGAAAAAVAMVAVGAVMLVLGPIVIVLRALDERRQERRFLKLSGQDDLPPSYEQATLMDEAPRYSTLSLNTITCSPAATAAAAAASAAAAVTTATGTTGSSTVDSSTEGDAQEV